MGSEAEKFKRRFVVGLTVLTLVVGWGGAAVMLGCFPHRYVKVFPYIPSCFFLWELLFVTLLEKNRNRGNMIRLFLGMKAAKMLLCILLIGLYTIVVGERNAEFVVTFLAFYLIYLVFETVSLGRFGKKTKKGGSND